jgi:Holliday junction resolvase
VERKTQTKLIKFLRGKGAYTLKLTPGKGVPVGCVDVIALYLDKWFAFEVKASEKAPLRPLQAETIKKLSAWGYVRVVYPGNLNEVLAELENLL